MRNKIKLANIHHVYTKFGKPLAKLLKSKDFQKGAALFISAGIFAFFLVQKNKDELRKREQLLNELIRKHEAIIKELSVRNEISKERQDRLLNLDLELKHELELLKAEIVTLKAQVADLQKEEK